MAMRETVGVMIFERNAVSCSECVEMKGFRESRMTMAPVYLVRIKGHKGLGIVHSL